MTCGIFLFWCLNLLVKCGRENRGHFPFPFLYLRIFAFPINEFYFYLVGTVHIYSPVPSSDELRGESKSKWSEIR